MNRRQFLARTAVLNVPLLAAQRVFAQPWQTAPESQFERVIADARFAPSIAFAEAMARKGVRISTIDGDPTRLWFDDLARHFASGSAPIAGLTSERTALVMTELARGPGVRVLWDDAVSPGASGVEETLTSWILVPHRSAG